MTNSLQETIDEKITINLERSVNLKEFENILKYIQEHLPAQVDYQASQHNALCHSSDRSRSYECKGTASVNGYIRQLDEPMAFDGFETLSDRKDTSLISAIRFNMVPGWDLPKYREENIQLWDVVREQVQEYFTSKED